MTTESIRADKVGVGRGKGEDVEIEFKTGDGTSNKKMKFSESEQALQFGDDDAGFANFGTGGGSSTNYFENPNFETNAVDGIAASGAVAPTIEAETVAPLYGATSSKITSGAGTGIIDYNIGLIDRGVVGSEIVTQISAHLKTDGLVADGDWTAGVYDTTLAAYVVAPTDLKADRTNIYRTPFRPLFITADRYKLRVEFTDTTAGRVLVNDKFNMTPDSNSGLIETDGPLLAVDLSLANFESTTGLSSAHGGLSMKRQGSDLFLSFSAGWLGVGSSGSVFKLVLPTYEGETLTILEGVYSGGSMQNDPNSTGANRPVHVFATAGDADTGLSFSPDFTTNTPLVGTQMGNGAAGNIAHMDISTIIPITNWQNQGKVNLLTQDVITSNSRYSSRVTGTANTVADNALVPFVQTELENEGGGFEKAGDNEVRIKFNGWMSVTGGVFITTSPAISQFQLLIDNVALANEQYIMQNQNLLKFATEVKVSAGSLLSLKNVSGGARDINGTQGVVVTRLLDYGAFDPIGFALATDTRAGLGYKVADSVKITSGNLVTTSGTFVDITGTSITLVLPTASRVAYAFNCTGAISAATTSSFYYNVEIDGTTLLYGANGIQAEDSNLANHEVPICLSGLTEELAAGSHTFVVQHAVDGANTLNSFANSNTALTFAVWTI